MATRILALLITFYCTCHANTNWHPATYAWSLGFALESDVILSQPEILEGYNPKAAATIKKGDIVWINGEDLATFFHKDFIDVKAPFFLVIGGSDLTFPDDYRRLLDIDSLIDSKKIIHIFAQNNALGQTNTKVSSIPIGMDYHTLLLRPFYFNTTKQSIEEQDQQLKTIPYLLPFENRIPLVVGDFHHKNTSHRRWSEDRKQIAAILRESNVAALTENPMPREQLWVHKIDFRFSASPHGRGLDCHRTWEDLILGCIVIVKTSPLDSLYEDLPVVIVQDWHDVTEENLKIWEDQYRDIIEDGWYRDKLTHAYWMQKIKVMQQYYLHKLLG